MSTPIVFRAEALAEIDEAFKWYESKASGLGLEFLRAVEAAADSISRRADAWPVVHKNLRSRLLRRFPYSLIYRLDPDGAVSMACFHARRDPRRWQSRV